MGDVDLEVYGAPDLTYDFGLADTVASAANAAASAVEGQTASRASYVASAKEDFRGAFSELFAANATPAASDARELARGFRPGIYDFEIGWASAYLIKPLLNGLPEAQSYEPADSAIRRLNA